MHYVAEKESPLAQEIDRLLAARRADHWGPGRGTGGPVPPGSQAERRHPGSRRRALQGIAERHRRHQAAPEIQRGNTARNTGHRMSTACRTARTPARVKAVVKEPDRRHQEGARTRPVVLETQLAETTAELGRLRESLDQVRRDAMTDGLTVRNRKAFDERLEIDLQKKPTPRGEGMTLAMGASTSTISRASTTPGAIRSATRCCAMSPASSDAGELRRAWPPATAARNSR